MFCRFCGAQLPDGSVFCATCGKSLAEAPQPAPVQPPVQPPVQQTPPPAPQPAPVQPPVQQTPARVQTPPAQKAPVKGRVMWWIFAGVALFILLVSLCTMGVMAAAKAFDDYTDDVWIPEYVAPDIAAPEPEPTVEPDPFDDPDSHVDWGEDPIEEPVDGSDDWNADGSWELDEYFLFGKWVSDLYQDGTAECLVFDYDGNLELWEGYPGSDDDIYTWEDGDWVKTLLYSGSYWTDGDYLTMDFGDDGTNTYYVEMASLYEIVVHFDDGTTSHFEQVAW